MNFTAFHQPLDPDGQLDFTLPILLNDGEAIASANVTFVDATSTNAAAGTTPAQVGSVSSGVISGNLWGVTVWLNGNSSTPGKYYVRFRGATDSVPPRQFDKTVELTVAQT